MEISMWMFLVIAVVMAIVIGRAGTLLKDYFQQN
jgi:Sec-independent protein translocase protein TatA